MLPISKTPANRLAHIDGLRGLAILLVLLTHTWAFSGAPSLAVHLGGHAIVLAALPAVGYVGVNLFLVLSGFCLAWPFMRDRTYRDRMSLRQFWMRRVRRIVPAYYASMVIVVAISLAFSRLIPSHLRAAAPQVAMGTFMADLWPHLIFAHNFFVNRVSAINGSYWSLALEFQFYMAFPLLVEAVLRWGPWRILAITLALQLAYRCALEAWIPSALNEFEFVLPKAMPGRIVDFVCGIAAASLVAEAHVGQRGILGRRLMSGCAAACLVAAFTLTAWRAAPQSVIDVIWAFGFGSLVCSASSAGSICNRLFSWRPLVLLGLCSYSVYLLHQPLIERSSYLALLFMKPGKAFLFALGMLPVIVGICVVFFLLCEKPCLDYFARKDRVRHAAQARPRQAAAIASGLEGVASPT